jgi:hypothetical protein
MSFIIFSQAFGGAIFLAFAQTIFSNSLNSELVRYAPSVNPEVVIAAGATSIQSVVAESELAGVLMAYSTSVDRVFYLATATGVAWFFFAWGMGWRDVRKKPPVVQGEA